MYIYICTIRLCMICVYTYGLNVTTYINNIYIYPNIRVLHMYSIVIRELMLEGDCTTRRGARWGADRLGGDIDWEEDKE